MNNFIIKGNICFSTSGKELKTLSGYAVVLDDSILPHPLDLNVRQRIERAVYLSLDLCGGIKEKYVCGEKIGY